MWQALALFPWWLWLLAGCWAALLAGRWQMRPDSEWLRAANVLLVVYSWLLAVLGVQSVWMTLPTASTPTDSSWLQSVAAGCALGGVLIAVTTRQTRWERIGRSVSFAGMTLLAVSCSAYELAVLIVLLAAVALRNRHAAAPATEPLPGGTSWFVGGLTTLVCVLTLGLLPHGLRAARPSATTAEAAVVSTETAGGSLTWDGLVLLGVLICLQARTRPLLDDDKSSRAAGTADDHNPAGGGC